MLVLDTVDEKVSTCEKCKLTGLILAVKEELPDRSSCLLRTTLLLRIHGARTQGFLDSCHQLHIFKPRSAQLGATDFHGRIVLKVQESAAVTAIPLLNKSSGVTA